MPSRFDTYCPSRSAARVFLSRCRVLALGCFLEPRRGFPEIRASPVAWGLRRLMSRAITNFSVEPIPRRGGSTVRVGGRLRGPVVLIREIQAATPLSTRGRRWTSPILELEEEESYNASKTIVSTMSYLFGGALHGETTPCSRGENYGKASNHRDTRVMTSVRTMTQHLPDGDRREVDENSWRSPRSRGSDRSRRAPTRDLAVW